VTSAGSGPSGLPSTKWEWKLVKLSEAPPGEGARWHRQRRHAFLPWRNRRLPAIVEVKYKGGAESQWWVKTRGKTFVVPGHLAFEDVMVLVYGEDG
jgi:hypothetical protein